MFEGHRHLIRMLGSIYIYLGENKNHHISSQPRLSHIGLSSCIDRFFQRHVGKMKDFGRFPLKISLEGG